MLDRSELDARHARLHVIQMTRDTVLKDHFPYLSDRMHDPLRMLEEAFIAGDFSEESYIQLCQAFRQCAIDGMVREASGRT